MINGLNKINLFLWPIVITFFTSFTFANYSYEDLKGSWEYTSFFYQDHLYPRPNPNLHVIFNFESDSVVRLSWTIDGEDTFCERIADYQINGNILYQKVTWVNPNNTQDCAKDEDMRLDKESNTKILIEDSDLKLYLELNGEDFLYILHKK